MGENKIKQTQNIKSIHCFSIWSLSCGASKSFGKGPKISLQSLYIHTGNEIFNEINLCAVVLMHTVQYMMFYRDDFDSPLDSEPESLKYSCWSRLVLFFWQAWRLNTAPRGHRCHHSGFWWGLVRHRAGERFPGGGGADSCSIQPKDHNNPTSFAWRNAINLWHQLNCFFSSPLSDGINSILEYFRRFHQVMGGKKKNAFSIYFSFYELARVVLTAAEANEALI